MTPQAAQRLIKQFAPYAMGAILFGVGLWQSQMAYISLAAGMIGVPGVASAMNNDEPEAATSWDPPAMQGDMA